MAEFRRSSREVVASVPAVDRLLAFADFRFNPRTGELWRGSSEIKLAPRVASVLGLLAERSQQLVTKQDLIHAAWQERIVGDEALTSCIQELRRTLGDDARQPRLIETRHKRGYRLMVPASWSMPAPSMPVDRPSIAVLPFDNLSGDPEQEYFVDGLVEDIVTELSKFRELLVAARGSSFTYKGRATEVKEVGRNLGVRYVLEGSVRKAGSKVRITGQLIDCETGVNVWANRFDATFEDVFDLQDRVTSNVVRAIAPAVQFAETERTRRKPTANLDAYDWFLRGSAAVWEGRAREAISHFKKAIERDGRYAEAYGMCAGAYVTAATYEGILISPGEKTEALEFADMAATLGTDDALALARAAQALAFFGREYERASAMIERAVGLNPNLSSVWLQRGWINIWGSNVERAENSFSRVLQFSELDPARIGACSGRSYCCFYLGRYEEGCAWAVKALQKYVNAAYLRPLIMNAIRAGRKDEAREAATRLLQISPNWRTSQMVHVRNVELQTAARLALREAGLPD